MVRTGNNEALNMLQTTVLHTGTEVREALAKGLNDVQTSNTVAQQETATKVADELNRMRTTIRDASRESINTARSELGHEVQGLLTGVRADLRSLTEMVRDRQAEFADVPAPVSAVAATGVAVPHQRTSADAEVAIQSNDDVEDMDVVQGDDSEPVSHVLEETVGAEAVITMVREALQPLHDTVADLCTRVEHSEQAAGTVTAQLTELSEEVVALRAQLQSTLSAQPDIGDGAASPACTEERKEHRRLLRRAAQVSNARLVCHRDSWEFLSGQAGRHPHFRVPAPLADHGEGRVSAALSGRSLIAVLISLDETRHATPDGDDADWAMAETAYERMSAALTALGTKGETVTVTLDDRTPVHDTEPAQDADESEEREAGA